MLASRSPESTIVRRELDDVWGSLVRGIQPPAGETATGRVAAMRAPGELAREAASRRSIRLATGEAGLAMARRFVARATVAAGWEDHVDDVALLASELATNAVLHGARAPWPACTSAGRWRTPAGSSGRGRGCPAARPRG